MNAVHQKKSKHLLIPAMPTPNGSMHLGHIAGPYLKMDVIKRAYQQNGELAHLYGGIDAIDSFVLLKAKEEGRTSSEVCASNYDSIVKSFKRLNIEFDQFINPLASVHAAEYQRIMAAMVDESINSKGYLKEEAYPLNNEGEYCPVSFMVGECPVCCCSMTGLVCEACGKIYEPETIVRRQNFQSKLARNFFISVDNEKIENWLSELTLRRADKEHALKLLKSTKEVRLTVPKTWGLAKDDGHSFFNYTNNFPYFYYLGSLYQQAMSLSTNPFDQGADVKTTLSFGYDNFIAYFVCQEAQVSSLAHKKSFDTYLPSRFLTLGDGMKFSTSRNHAVWVENLSKKVSADLLRLYLIKVNSDEVSQNFSLSDFIVFHNNLAKIINAVFDHKKTTAPMGESLLKAYCELMMVRDTCVASENYNASKLYKVINKWFELNADLEEHKYAAWFHALCLLSYPVMPTLALENVADSELDVQSEIYYTPRPINYIDRFDITIG